MKEISDELAERSVTICTSCGAIYKETSTIRNVSCPQCGKRFLRWVTPNHGWIDELKPRGKS